MVEGAEGDARRIVAGIEHAYLFEHFDSRGGSTVVLAPSLHRAMEVYVEPFQLSNDGPTDEDFQITEHDYAGELRMVVCDQDFEQTDLDTELLSSYGGKYKAAWLRVRIGKSRWQTPMEGRTLVLWTGKRPNADEIGFHAMTGPYTYKDEPIKFKYVKEELGEDAFGLILMDASTRRSLFK